MNWFKEHLRPCFVVSIGFALGISLFGCSRPPLPPFPVLIMGSTSNPHIEFLRWKEGLKVVFVDDVVGNHTGDGQSSADDPVYTETVSAAASDTSGYKCQIETKDGKSATCRINGKDYDLSNGALFVIKAKGEQVEVHQLKRDLTAIPFDGNGSGELQKDTEIRKLLDLGEIPR